MLCTKKAKRIHFGPISDDKKRFNCQNRTSLSFRLFFRHRVNWISAIWQAYIRRFPWRCGWPCDRSAAFQFLVQFVEHNNVAQQRTEWAASRRTPLPLAVTFPAGRGHAPFLETLIINKLQNAAWKRSQKESTFPRPILKDIWLSISYISPPWPRPAIYLAIHRTPAIAVQHHNQRCVRNDSLGNIKQVLAVHPPMPEKMMLLCSCQCRCDKRDTHRHDKGQWLPDVFFKHNICVFLPHLQTKLFIDTQISKKKITPRTTWQADFLFLVKTFVKHRNKKRSAWSANLLSNIQF